MEGESASRSGDLSTKNTRSCIHLLLYPSDGQTKHVAAAAAALSLLFQEFEEPTPSMDSSVVSLVLARTYDASPCFKGAARDVTHFVHIYDVS